MDTLLFHLSLALGISYYKLFPTYDLVVETWKLTEDQREFWKDFYTQWLWEFFYTNKLSPRSYCNFVDGVKTAPATLFHSTSSLPMIALGWGKDSLVSVEAVKKLTIPFYTSTFGKDYHLHKVVGDRIWAPRLVMLRTMDPKLFEMNSQWYYNGHVPISGIIAFVLVTGAYLYDYRYIIMSNEKSANEGNTVLDGISINHQRSKSYQFESDFNQYSKRYLSPEVEYFSLLRGMYEIKIAKIFAQYPQYFDSFSSCNNNFKVIEANKTTDQRRCGKCPKCAFVYATLRPFVSDADIQRIFGQELYNRENLLPLYKELLGIQGIKPFECVGTNEEVAYAMYLYYENIKDHSQFSPIMDFFRIELLPTLSPSQLLMLEKKLFTTTSEDTNIPSMYHEIIDSY